MAGLKPFDRPKGPQIRWLIRADMPSIMEIEDRCFDFPWTEEEFLCCLRDKRTIGTVYESANDLIYGFMVYELNKSMLRLISIAVAPEVQRTGVGRAMIERLIDKIGVQKRTSIETMVREGNLAAQLFFSRMGFLAVESVRGEYSDGCKEDGILFRFVEGPHRVIVDEEHSFGEIDND